ncbi:uncharacterized protein [Acropora muricata]|uniref:uncharacterized protein isoform X2 n=1 Tax=Acropora muricata TaxID=159855 RepID=UPI0034E4F729
MREAADFAGEMREPFSCTTKVTLESGKVVRYEYLKEHSEISSRNEVPRCEQKTFNLLRKENSTTTTTCRILMMRPAAKTKTVPFLNYMMWKKHGARTKLRMFWKSRGLKELQQNQEKLLENRNGIQKSLTAIEQEISEEKTSPGSCDLAFGSSQAQLKQSNNPIAMARFHCPISQPHVSPSSYSSFVPDGTFKPFKLH